MRLFTIIAARKFHGSRYNCRLHKKSTAMKLIVFSPAETTVNQSETKKQIGN
jgi:hypothetical protein